MAKSITAAELMTPQVTTTREETLLTDVIELLLRHSTSCLPVVDTGNALVGIVTEYDVMNFAFSGEADRTTVSEAMSRNVITLSPDAPFEYIVTCCVNKRMHRVPVVDQDGKVVGIISRRDVLRGLLDLYRAHMTIER